MATDPTAGKGDPTKTYNGGIVALPSVGADANSPSGSTSPGLDHYGVGDGQASQMMQNMSGPGSTETTMSTVNASSTGNTSMQDQSGPGVTATPQPMNTSPGPSSNNNQNDMTTYERTITS